MSAGTLMDAPKDKVDSGIIDPGTVTELLERWKQGDSSSAGKLFDQLHEELRRLAAAKMRQERSGHTLQPTALVNEAYLRLGEGDAVQARNREHFLAIAARVMSRILTDYAREHKAQKRGGGALVVTLDSEVAGSQGRNVELLSLAEALDRLAKTDPRKAEIVSQRFLCGATVAEISVSLNLSERTVMREWAFSRAWLLRELGG